MKQKWPIAKNLFLIVRGPKSAHHNAPYHPVILCSRKHIAKWEASRTSNGDTVFESMAENGNWLLVRYKGYDIDYGNVVAYFTLLDGLESQEVSAIENIQKYLSEAVWWSYDQMPEWIKELGVKYPEDQFTKDRIKEDSGLCMLPHCQESRIREKTEYYIEQAHWLW